MKHWVVRCVLLFAAACSSSTAPQPGPTGPVASLVDTRTGADDLQVATVNGRPIWGSCVTAQTTRGKTREQALDDCIGFELMAQAAEARGLGANPEVVAATRTALVSRLVAVEYEQKFTTPAAFGDVWTRLVDKNRWRHDHPEVRGSAYVRVPVAKNAPPAADRAARAIADELAAALAAERGLTAPHLFDIAKRVVGARAALDQAVVPPNTRDGRLDESYVAPLFAIPEVGRTSPAARTRWGYDVILWTSVIPAEHATPDQLATALLPDVRRSFFPVWVNKIAHRLGARIDVFDNNLPLLENL